METLRAMMVTATVTVLLSLLAASQEIRIRRSDLPPAVEKVVVTQSQGATIRGFSQEKENGKTFYETELTVDGHSRDILMDVEGTVVEVEEQISAESLPPAVQNGLQAKAGKGKLVKFETLTKRGKLVAYEAQVLTKGKKSEVQVGSDGKSLPQEE